MYLPNLIYGNRRYITGEEIFEYEVEKKRKKTLSQEVNQGQEFYWSEIKSQVKQWGVGVIRGTIEILIGNRLVQTIIYFLLLTYDEVNKFNKQK